MKLLPLTAENPCELNCMPRGENFFYRHRRAVVDGTPCHPGRRDVCVDGVCKVRLHGKSTRTRDKTKHDKIRGERLNYIFPISLLIVRSYL